MKTKLKIIPILLLLLAVILSACQSDATETAEVTAVPATDVPTEAVPTATTAPSPNDPAVILGEPDGYDPFDNADNWTLFNNDCFSSNIVDGQFVMTAKGLPGIVCWEVSWPEILNFYYEIEVYMPEVCQPDDRFGLFFRAPDTTRGYLYGLTCDGHYTMTDWDGSTTNVIVEPATSEYINTGPGAVNRIGVAAYGSSYLLYANGYLLAQASNSTFVQEGLLGLYVRASTTEPFTVEYDNLKVWLLTDQYYPPDSTAPPPTQPLPPPPEGSATVTTITYVNVRSGPSLDYPIYFVAPPGAVGQAIGISADGQWYAVVLPTDVSASGTGWLSAAYVIPANTEGLPVMDAPAPPPTVEPPPPDDTSATVTNFEPLNVRSGPSTSYPSYGVAPIGSTAPVIGISEDNQWYVVAISTEHSPDGTGWVNYAYVVLDNPSGAAIPVIPNPDEEPPVEPPPPSEGTPMVTSTDAINVRNGPSNSCASYGVAAIGASAQAVGISADGTWIQILIPTDIAPDGYGWVNVNYLIQSNTENLPITESANCP